jgi:hypothetical protein
MKPIPTPKNVAHHLRAMHDRLNDGWANVDDAWWTSEAAAIIERLVDQRDEARREVCAHEADTSEDQRQYAEQRGWDCFPPSEEPSTISYKETP